MGRSFIGIDASAVAIDTIRARFEEMGQGLEECARVRLGAATA
jgi:hypothetical protein